MDKKPTLFCDIDGTIFKYRPFETYETSSVEVLPGVKEAMLHWHNEGVYIVLTTARPEYLRSHTIKELKECEIPYHQLVMGIGRGTRYLINDKEDPMIDRSIAISIDRNMGFNKKDITL